MIAFLTYLAQQVSNTPRKDPDEVLTDYTGKALAICVAAIIVVVVAKKLGGSKKQPESPNKPPSKETLHEGH